MDYQRKKRQLDRTAVEKDSDQPASHAFFPKVPKQGIPGIDRPDREHAAKECDDPSFLSRMLPDKRPDPGGADQQVGKKKQYEDQREDGCKA